MNRTQGDGNSRWRAGGSRKSFQAEGIVKSQRCSGSQLSFFPTTTCHRKGVLLRTGSQEERSKEEKPESVFYEFSP